MSHTPTPWHCKQLTGAVYHRDCVVLSEKQSEASRTTHRVDRDGKFDQADAEFIVRACNAHDQLVALLVEVADRFADMREAQSLDKSLLSLRIEASLTALEGK